MIQIAISDEQLPHLAALIAKSPELASLVAGELRGRRDAYTVAEAAEKLGVTSKTIRNRIEAKIIPIIPGVGPKRIPAAYIEKLLNPNPDK